MAECQAAMKKASVDTQAIGTWKKTIREDSPTKFWAGRAQRKAAQQIAAIPSPRSALTVKPRPFTTRMIPPGRESFSKAGESCFPRSKGGSGALDSLPPDGVEEQEGGRRDGAVVRHEDPHEVEARREVRLPGGDLRARDGRDERREEERDREDREERALGARLRNERRRERGGRSEPECSEQKQENEERRIPDLEAHEDDEERHDEHGHRAEQRHVREKLSEENPRRGRRQPKGRGGPRVLLVNERARKACHRGEKENDPEKNGVHGGPVLRGEARRAHGIGDEDENGEGEEEERVHGHARPPLREELPPEHGDGRREDSGSRARRAHESVTLSSASARSRGSFEAITVIPRSRCSATTF